jgi:hypothetical protein
MTEKSLRPDLFTDSDRPRRATGRRILVAMVLLASLLPAATLSAPADAMLHWAFRAPVRPTLPVVIDARWSRNPIDRFVVDRLEREGLSPSPEAAKTTLLRRLSLDLIGLPPTLEELDSFLADDRADAFELQVTRLLESPHHGEHWGRHWLDVARYADSNGYEKDEKRTVWFYRDWVVAALNRDLPYDQFIVEQIAGDELDTPRQDHLVATGFLRNSMLNAEGGIEPEEFRIREIFDRLDAIGKGILGLTIQCGQCHDHKYDPLTQEDYYRMFAYLNNTHEASIVVYAPDEEKQRSELLVEIDRLEEKLRQSQPDWRERMAAWEKSVENNQPEWTVLSTAVETNSTSGQAYTLLGDGSYLVQGYSQAAHRVQLTATIPSPAIRAFRVELLTHPDLPLGGPGRAVTGTCALTEFELEVAPAGSPDQLAAVKIQSATADIDLPERTLVPPFEGAEEKRVTGPVTFAIDGDARTAWGIDAGPGRRNRSRKAVFVPESPIENPDGAFLRVSLNQQHGAYNSDLNPSQNIGRFRISITSSGGATADPVPMDLREILDIPQEQRSPQQRAAIFGHWRTTVPEWKNENLRINALWHRHPVGTPQLVLTARDRARETHILDRGDFLKPTKHVTPGTPAFLHALPADAPPTRLAFAKWLVDRRSPTAARAIVNRVWQSYFGSGLVRSSEDLGTQSEPASHPELLDWLAVEFMENSWSPKALHRLIVTSSTYRQSSRVSSNLLARDPRNRWLGRGSRFRVNAETVRDIALAASGLLYRRIGGRSVFPPIPEFLIKPPASFTPKIWREDKGAQRYRRALYTFRFRSSAPYPVFRSFDAPTGESSCVRRERSNTPLQALVTLNETLYIECARELARRALIDGGATDRERVRHAFRCCLSRNPDDEEVVELLALLSRQRSHFAAHPSLAAELSAPSANFETAELASWTVISRVILNLDETITRD